MNEKKIITDSESAVRGINKFMFFSWNFSSEYYEWTDWFGHARHEVLPTFIWELRDKWTCGFDHVVDKWHGVCEDSRSSHDLIPMFYGRMGAECRRIMLEWIVENYTDEQAL